MDLYNRADAICSVQSTQREVLNSFRSNPRLRRIGRRSSQVTREDEVAIERQGMNPHVSGGGGARGHLEFFESRTPSTIRAFGDRSRWLGSPVNRSVSRSKNVGWTTDRASKGSYGVATQEHPLTKMGWACPPQYRRRSSSGVQGPWSGSQVPRSRKL